MQNDERVDSLVVAVKSALKGNNAQIWTALPGVVQSVDLTAMTCEVQPTVQIKVYDKLGNGTFVNLPLCVDVPIQFIGGGGYTLTFPMAPGDEGLVVFSCRCIDAWWQSGGVQPQVEMRMHDLSDGFFIPGFRSQPRVLSSVNGEFPELRNDAGTIKLQATLTGFRVQGTLEVSGSLMLGGSIEAVDGSTYTADIHTSGNVVGGYGGADQVGLTTHEHSANNTPPTAGT